MAIISPIGRKALKVRLLVGTITGLLLLGAVTMIYPFALMIAGSTKSAIDTPDATIIPAYLKSDTALYQKHMEALFNEKLEFIDWCYGQEFSGFDVIAKPTTIRNKWVDKWVSFTKSTHPEPMTYGIGHSIVQHGNVRTLQIRAFQDLLVKKYGEDINDVNKAFGTDYESWTYLTLPTPQIYLRRRENPSTTPYAQAVDELKEQVDPAFRFYSNIEGFYKTTFIKTQYSKKIETFNAEHGSEYKSYDQIYLERRYPTAKDHTKKEQQDWEDFVRSILCIQWIRADKQAEPLYQAFLKAKYTSNIALLNKSYSTNYTSFNGVPLIDVPPIDGGLRLADWASFVEGWKDPDTLKNHALPVEMIHLSSIEYDFRAALQQEYKTLNALNQSLKTSFTDWRQIQPPQQEFHARAFESQKSMLRWEFTIRNYITVLDFIALHGRGLINTVIYCSLAVLSALIVNPLAAYALSRYKPPSAYKMLLFVMLTMAFPPMVTQIPVFLMLRDLHLLNTFWALILPTLANGYAIFLLKGFFDSLPQELYESAELDGAGEFRIFWQITMSLSTPILAVVALQAFTAAYSNFMFALLICQDQDMWTIMPWLYQLQTNSGQGVIYASLLVAAVPTFLIFAFCQNIIMRGIVVPVEK